MHARRLTGRGWSAAAALFVLMLWTAPVGAFPQSGPRSGGSPEHNFSSYSVAAQAFMYLDAFYVEPKRIEPIPILESAFRQLESQYPEVVVDLAADRRSVAVKARGFEKSFPVKPDGGTSDIAATIDAVVDFVAERLGSDVEKDKLLYLTINGGLRALDPHTNIFGTKHFKDFKVSTSGSFGGIGFTFNVQEGELTIVSPIPDTPASRAGLQSGDRIVFIDGLPTTNMSSDAAVGMMRGEPGTKVTITVAREGWSEPRDFSITREIIRIVSVESRLLEGEGGAPPVIYARIKNFQTDTSGELAAAIRRLEKPGVAGIVLDLRDNPGGLLEEAVKVADGFLDGGPIVSTRSRSGRGKVESARLVDEPFSRLPLVVLVNRGSASASEIVSAALENARALLIGERTFGKGSVQQAFPLSDGGGVLVTVSQYLTPGDVSIQSIGVEPDVALLPTLVSPERLLLEPLKDHPGEATLQNAFSTWGNARRTAAASVRYLQTAPRGHEARAKEPRDREPTEAERAEQLAAQFEVRLARRVLAAALGRPDAGSQSGLLAVARHVVAEADPEEEKRIAAALKERGLEWTAAAGAPGSAKLVATLPEGQVLRAAEKAKITVAVTNQGGEALHRVWGRTESANPLLRNLDFAFGALAPGETRTWTTELDVPKGVEERWDTVTIKLRADGVPDAGSFSGSLQTEARPAPQFAYDFTVEDENLAVPAKSGDGRLEEGERARITVRLKNRGAVESPLVEVNLHADEKEQLYLEEARRKIEKLAAGAEQSAPLSFKVVKPLESGKVKVNLTFSDRSAGAFFSDSLEIPTAVPYPAGDSRIPPQLALGEVPPLVTDRDEVTLAVSASDDVGVKDVVVYRGEKKLLYSRNREGAAPFPVRLAVPLESGSNRITIIARDDRDLPVQKVVYVFRRDGKPTAAATPAALPASR